MKFRPVFALGLAALFGASNVYADCGCSSGAAVAVSGSACGGGCGVAASDACGPQVTYVEKTVMVPTQVTEKRQVSRTVYRTEVRQRDVQVMVNQSEVVKKEVVRRVPVTRQVKETVYVNVPSTVVEDVPYTVCRTVYDNVEQKIAVNVCRPVVEDVPYTVQVPTYTDEVVKQTVKVPVTTKQEGVRTVCRMVPVKTVKQVTRDCGSYQTVVEEVPCAPAYVAPSACSTGCGAPVAAGCGTQVSACGCGAPAVASSGCGCGGAAVSTGCAPVAPATRTVCKKVWVPNIVVEDVEVTTLQPQQTEEPYTYNVTTYEDQVREVKVRRCTLVPQERTRKVTRYVNTTEEKVVNVRQARQVQEQLVRKVTRTVCTKEAREVVRNVVECEERRETIDVKVNRLVPSVRQENYTVCVPETVVEEVDVTVCRLVPTQVTVPVTTSAGCGAGVSYDAGCGAAAGCGSYGFSSKAFGGSKCGHIGKRKSACGCN